MIAIDGTHCYKNKCRWFMGVIQPDGTEMTERLMCPAFPEGIPNEITTGDNQHTEVYEGQSGHFLFEPETGEISGDN
jgi:hypothetical protein